MKFTTLPPSMDAAIISGHSEVHLFVANGILAAKLWLLTDGVNIMIELNGTITAFFKCI